MTESAHFSEPLLTDDLLERIRSRAAGHDRENTFFDDDLDELVALGYLRALVPVEFGGLGFSLERTAREQLRLASAAPATALAVNMHLVWTGVAKVLHDRGDDSLDFVLREAGRRRDLRLRAERGGQRPRAVRFDDGCATGARRRLPLLRHQDLHLPLPRLDAARHDGPRHDQRRRAEDRLRLRRARRRRVRGEGGLGHHRHAGQPEQHDRARRRPRPADRIVRRLDPGPNPDSARLRDLRQFRDPARRRLHRDRRSSPRTRQSRPHAAGPPSRTTDAPTRRTRTSGGASPMPRSRRTRSLPSSTRSPATSTSASTTAVCGSPGSSA